MENNMRNTMATGAVHRIAANLYGVTYIAVGERPRGFVVTMDATSEHDACEILAGRYAGEFRPAMFERAVFKCLRVEVLDSDSLPLPRVCPVGWDRVEA